MSNELQDSGERMIPAVHKGTITYAEHYSRYVLASKFTNNKVVLDIASGTGYGTKLLSEGALSVVGVDVDRNAISYARENYSANNIDYKIGNGTTIPCESSQFDVVVSMETIEHIEDQDGFLEEIKRVLKPGGLLILSTPNDKVSPKGNHYHVREHTKSSLSALMKEHFKHIKLAYQTVDISASIFDESTLKSEHLSKKVEVLKQNHITPDDSLFYLVFASDEVGILENLSLESIVMLGETYSHMKQKLNHDTIEELNNLAHRYQKDINDLLKGIKSRDQEIARLKNSKLVYLKSPKSLANKIKARIIRKLP